ncbi:hypothetical protein KAI87_17235, partial [Myxococcota bacterium]|nr:hypothetical protein [Myxococcota bacterium]
KRRKGRKMNGTITTKNLVVNAPTIIYEFGVATYFRCIVGVVFSRRDVTFLEMAVRLKHER